MPPRPVIAWVITAGPWPLVSRRRSSARTSSRPTKSGLRGGRLWMATGNRGFCGTWRAAGRSGTREAGSPVPAVVGSSHFLDAARAAAGASASASSRPIVGRHRRSAPAGPGFHSGHPTGTTGRARARPGPGQARRPLGGAKLARRDSRGRGRHGPARRRVRLVHLSTKLPLKSQSWKKTE